MRVHHSEAVLGPIVTGHKRGRLNNCGVTKEGTMNSERNSQASNRLRAPARSDSEKSSLRKKRAGLSADCSVIGLLLLLCVAAAVTIPTPSFSADIGISIRIGPPPLPVYEQPLCPGDGLSLDSRLLGIRSRGWILLGSRHLGAGA